MSDKKQKPHIVVIGQEQAPAGTAARNFGFYPRASKIEIIMPDKPKPLKFPGLDAYSTTPANDPQPE